MFIKRRGEGLRGAGQGAADTGRRARAGEGAQGVNQVVGRGYDLRFA